MEKADNNGNGKKLLFGWISLLIGLIGAIVSVTLAITQPDSEMRQDIALIKQSVEKMQTNELVHIQSRLDEQQTTIITILQEISKNQALLGQHLKQ